MAARRTGADEAIARLDLNLSKRSVANGVIGLPARGNTTAGVGPRHCEVSRSPLQVALRHSS